jgi:hypothetical protein
LLALGLGAAFFGAGLALATIFFEGCFFAETFAFAAFLDAVLFQRPLFLLWVG